MRSYDDGMQLQAIQDARDAERHAAEAVVREAQVKEKAAVSQLYRAVYSMQPSSCTVLRECVGSDLLRAGFDCIGMLEKLHAF